MNKSKLQALLANQIVGRTAIILALLVGAILYRTASAANRDFSLDQCSLAIVTKHPMGSARICDPATIRTLAKQGHAFEQNQMGMVSMLVVSPDYSPAEALQWFERAARKGYAPAQVNAAVMYINGWGTSPNYGAALQWLHEAARQGYGRAYYNLGILYLQGQGVPKDVAEAARDFLKGAEAGDSNAQTNLGYLYDSGIGVPRDLKTAVQWYTRAADNGNAFAENNLADLYLRGEGLPQDDATAFRLFHQAAAQGETGARIKLGYMYSAGRGTPKDLPTAYSWIMAAATAGDKRGDDLMRSIETQLSPAQLAQAKENARKLNAEGDAQLSAQALQP